MDPLQELHEKIAKDAAKKNSPPHLHQKEMPKEVIQVLKRLGIIPDDIEEIVPPTAYGIEFQPDLCMSCEQPYSESERKRGTRRCDKCFALTKSSNDPDTLIRLATTRGTAEFRERFKVLPLPYLQYMAVQGYIYFEVPAASEGNYQRQCDCGELPGIHIHEHNKGGHLKHSKLISAYQVTQPGFVTIVPRWRIVYVGYGGIEYEKGTIFSAVLATFANKHQNSNFDELIERMEHCYHVQNIFFLEDAEYDEKGDVVGGDTVFKNEDPRLIGLPSLIDAERHLESAMLAYHGYNEFCTKEQLKERQPYTYIVCRLLDSAIRSFAKCMLGGACS
jgi:hypothetical protein